MTGGSDAREPPGALAGVRVLDLSSVVMGPFATQLMGDMGADVISVEAPGGDANRFMGVGPDPLLSGVAMNLLRNKRAVCLDLKLGPGREAFLRIAATCDVVVTNLRPSPLARLGLTYEDVRAVRPDVVFCQAHGWPSDSGRADAAAYDDIVQAATGLSDAFVRVVGDALYAPTLVADKVCGLTILYAVLAALFHRERTGEGQYIEVPMIDVMTSFMLVEHGAGAIPVPPRAAAGNPRTLARNRRPYRTTDGYVAILAYSYDNFRDLLLEGGRADMLTEEWFPGGRLQSADSDVLYAVVSEIVATRSTNDWIRFCEVHDIAASRVTDLGSLVDSLPIGQHDRFGPYRQIGHGPRFSATPASIRRQAPTLGQHGDEVLAEVGYAPEEIAALRAVGVLQGERGAGFAG